MIPSLAPRSTPACDEAACPYVWRGTVDVAEGVPPDATVHVMYHLAGDPQWWAVEAEAPETVAGFTRYTFALAEHLFGPADEGDGPVIELVPFLRLPDGARVFDHNRRPGDFENATLDATAGWALDDPQQCAPEVGFIHFTLAPEVSRNVTLRRGGYLQVDYMLDRLPRCRGTHNNGHPAWDIVAAARFLPGGEVVSGSVRRFVSVDGHPTNEATPRPFVTRIPDTAEQVQLWFHNYSGAGNRCEDWDSLGGANYRFDVQPAPDDPRCVDVVRETGVHTEDPRMVHHAAFCLPYALDREEDARGCEFRVDGFGDGYVGHYGMPQEWLVAYLQTERVKGEVLAAGMYSQFRENGTGETGQLFALGEETSPGAWKVGFIDHRFGFQSVTPVDRTLTAFAFFVDVRRPGGEIVRLWQSRGGRNYRWDDAFARPTTTEYIPYGNIRWAYRDADVLRCPE